MRANVKPFVHWAIYKGYTVRFLSRTPQRVTGRLTMPSATVASDAVASDAVPSVTVAFTYEPHSRRIVLDVAPADDTLAESDASGRPQDGGTTLYINEYGWEVEP